MRHHDSLVSHQLLLGKKLIVVANFKQILAMCLDGASYTQIAHTLGWGLTPDVSIFRGSGPLEFWLKAYPYTTMGGSVH